MLKCPADLKELKDVESSMASKPTFDLTFYDLFLTLRPAPVLYLASICPCSTLGRKVVAKSSLPKQSSRPVL